MKNVFNDLEKKLPLEKIKADFFNYLDSDRIQPVSIVSSHEIDGSEKIFDVGLNDNFTLFSIGLNKKYIGLSYFPINVKVIVGNYFDDPKTGMYRIEKFIAELFNNYEFELGTIDFYHI